MTVTRMSPKVKVQVNVHDHRWEKFTTETFSVMHARSEAR